MSTRRFESRFQVVFANEARTATGLASIPTEATPRFMHSTSVVPEPQNGSSTLMLIRLFQHTTICWGLGLRRVMSRTLGDDRRRTASIFVPAARNRDRARIGGTCSP